MDSKLRETATERVMQAVQNTLADQRGRWVLAAHQQAKSEWALSVPLTVQGMPDEGAGSSASGYAGTRQVVIDRTFVDEAGTRWIIDFKTGDHRGGQVEDFLDREQARYVDQLNGYADIMRSMEQRPTRVGLYFPLLKGWREWEPPATVS
jgi:ATP-dependent helicase/nuclease subunit A